MQPLVILSDVHLGHRRCDDVAHDLARLVAAHPGHEIILDGDTFNLSCDPAAADVGESAATMLAAHPRLQAALARHLAAGDRVTLLPGNHDAALPRPSVRAALVGALGVPPDVGLTIEPWFIRRGGFHIEHGQLYDPPNSPTHPLVPPSKRNEPIGVELTRRFVGTWDAWDTFADHWTGSATNNIGLMIRRFGWQAGTASLHYCWLLVAIGTGTTIRSRVIARERQEGDGTAGSFAVSRDLDVATVRALLAAHPRPMHESALATCLRFGFDAVLALAAVPAGVVTGVLVSPIGGTALAALGLGYLIAARRSLTDRGANHMVEELREGAATVRRHTDATLVIFGHTHREDEAEGYMNLGAFGDEPTVARTYLYVGDGGRAERRSLAGLPT